MPRFIFLLLVLSPWTVYSTIEDIPISYQGRFRSAEAYANLWTHEISRTKNFKSIYPEISSLSFLLLLESKGIEILPPQLIENELFESFKIGKKTEEAFQERLKELQEKKNTPLQIKERLESEFPLIHRLKIISPLFKGLPGRGAHYDWYPLRALLIRVYDINSNSLQPIHNFTVYPDDHFQNIRKSYQKWLENNSKENLEELSSLLIHSYRSIEKTPYLEAHGKQLTYPSINQLKVETLYVRYPWIPLLIALYSIGALCLLFSSKWALFFISCAIFFHGFLLGIRCYILERPPVSNMFETVLYVPWVAACTTLLFSSFRKNRLALFAASLCSIILLALTEVADLNQNLDQVQAVLDSQFWLIIHVLMVVGSYGIFILAALLGHAYLILDFSRRDQIRRLKELSQLILNALYTGTIMLIGGTILGGIWAAQSWGRFWDWDPKESWAFISSCLYVILIHLYRFHRIKSFGLACGSIIGVMAISFTWYGVNYLLGTGLHSYGFGSGGNGYYYLFLIFESLFLGSIFLFKHPFSNSKLPHS